MFDAILSLIDSGILLLGKAFTLGAVSILVLTIIALPISMLGQSVFCVFGFHKYLANHFYDDKEKRHFNMCQSCSHKKPMNW